MLEQYIEMVEQLCAADIAAQMQTLNTSQTQASQQMHGIYQTLSAADATSCLEAYVGYLSYSVTHKSPPEVLNSYMNAAIGVPTAQRAALQDAVAHAYTRIDAATSPHGPYFKTAGLYRIALLPALHDRLALAPVSGHTDEGYSYSVYQTLMEDQSGPDAFKVALTQAEPDVDATANLASGLSDIAILLRREGRDTATLLTVLAPLREDSRRTAGVNGPGSGAAIQDIVNPVFSILGSK